MKRKDVIRYLLLLLCIVLFTSFVIDPILAYYLDVTGAKDTFISLTSLETISAIIIAPVIEEIIFRTHLSFKRKHFYGIFFLIVYVGIIFNTFVVVTFIFVAAVLLFVLIFYEQTLKIVIVKNQKLTFFATSILFGCSHFFLLDAYDFGFFLKFTVLMLYYLPIAFLLGKIRKNHKLIFPMAAHSLYNVLTLFVNTIICYI